MSTDLQAVFPVSIIPGDTIQDYRGGVWTYVRPLAPSDPRREKIRGRVLVEHLGTREKREFYDVVFPGLVVYGTVGETRKEKGDDHE